MPSITVRNPSKGSSKGAKVEATGKTGKGGKRGAEAESTSGLSQDGRPQVLLGKGLFKDMKPLVQWTPDGVYWAKWQSTGEPSESPELDMDMSVV